MRRKVATAPSARCSATANSAAPTGNVRWRSNWMRTDPRLRSAFVTSCSTTNGWPRHCTVTAASTTGDSPAPPKAATRPNGRSLCTWPPAGSTEATWKASSPGSAAPAASRANRAPVTPRTPATSVGRWSLPPLRAATIASGDGLRQVEVAHEIAAGRVGEVEHSAREGVLHAVGVVGALAVGLAAGRRRGGRAARLHGWRAYGSDRPCGGFFRRRRGCPRARPARSARRAVGGPRPVVPSPRGRSPSARAASAPPATDGP